VRVGFPGVDSDNLRLFLFQTAFGSGAAPLVPFTPAEDLATRPEPDLATKRGRAAVRDMVPAGDARVDEAVDLSATFEGALVEAPLAARKVLLTETGLNEAGFLTDEEVRPWPFSSGLSFDREASLSDPPLMLTSAEFTRSSTMSEICLFSISSGAALTVSPFTCGWSESTCWASESILMVCSASVRRELWLVTRNAAQKQDQTHRLVGGHSSFIGSLLGCLCSHHTLLNIVADRIRQMTGSAQKCLVPDICVGK
jgi:hypothetical protein